MDIIALTASPLAASAPAAPQSAETGGGFALSLEQAVGRQPDAANQSVAADAATAAAQAQRTAVQSDAQAAAQAAQLTDSPLAGALLTAAGDALASAGGDAGSGDAGAAQGQPDATATQADLLAGLLAMPVAAPVTAAPAGVRLGVDDLQQIRERLTAIENAGNLDGQSVGGALTGALAVAANVAPNLLAGGAQASAAGAAVSSPQALSAALPGKAGARADGAFAQQVQRASEAAAASAAAPSQVAAAQAGFEQAALEARSLARSADEAPASALPAADNGASGPFAAVLTQAGGTTGDAASAPAASASLTAPLASPEWQKGLEQQVLGLHQRGEQRIELHLHPAELGPLSISLQLGESGAQAQFLSSHPQVRAAVEQAIPQLRETLAQQGITLGETSVGEQQYRSPQEQSSGGNGGSFAGNGNGSGTGVADVSLESRPVAVPLSLNGGIDLYA